MENGQMINKAVQVLNRGLMAQSTRASMPMGRKKVLGNSCGQMDQCMMGILLKIISMGKVLTAGQMEGSSSEIGWIIEWKEQVYSHGMMAENMKESIQMIKNMDKELSLGQMVRLEKDEWEKGNNFDLIY